MIKKTKGNQEAEVERGENIEEMKVIDQTLKRRSINIGKKEVMEEKDNMKRKEILKEPILNPGKVNLMLNLKKLLMNKWKIKL